MLNTQSTQQMNWTKLVQIPGVISITFILMALMCRQRRCHETQIQKKNIQQNSKLSKYELPTTTTNRNEYTHSATTEKEQKKWNKKKNNNYPKRLYLSTQRNNCNCIFFKCISRLGQCRVCVCTWMVGADGLNVRVKIAKCGRSAHNTSAP